jgi:chemotaxis-related protein WspD
VYSGARAGCNMVAETINDCWNRIGMRGDRSCERLRAHLHCHNCEVYADGARSIMHRRLPDGYRQQWAAVVAQPGTQEQAADASALVFRVGAEWLALPSKLCVTVAGESQAHKLPRRSGKILTGIVNVKGRIYPCASLAGLLDVDAGDMLTVTGRHVHSRILVMQFPQQAFALPVDEVHGIQAYVTADLRMPPATVNKGMRRYLTGVLASDDIRAGCLDPEMVGYHLARLLR